MMKSRLQRVKIWFTFAGPLQRAGVWLVVMVVFILLSRILRMFK
jgi:hypothetical protein